MQPYSSTASICFSFASICTLGEWALAKLEAKQNGSIVSTVVTFADTTQSERTQPCDKSTIIFRFDRAAHPQNLEETAGNTVSLYEWRKWPGVQHSSILDLKTEFAVSAIQIWSRPAPHEHQRRAMLQIKMPRSQWSAKWIRTQAVQGTLEGRHQRQGWLDFSQSC